MGETESMPGGDYSLSEELPKDYSEAEALFSRWMLDPEETLEELVHNLKGEKQNLKGEWYLPPGAMPLMNEYGIQSVVSSLRFVINKNTALSNLSEDDINKMCLDRSFYLVDRLSANLNEYGVKLTDLPTIVNDITDNVFIYLSRAKGGETLHGVQRVYRFLERSGEGKKEKDGGFNLGIFGKKGGK